MEGRTTSFVTKAERSNCKRATLLLLLLCLLTWDSEVVEGLILAEEATWSVDLHATFFHLVADPRPPPLNDRTVQSDYHGGQLGEAEIKGDC